MVSMSAGLEKRSGRFNSSAHRGRPWTMTPVSIITFKGDAGHIEGSGGAIAALALEDHGNVGVAVGRKCAARATAVENALDTGIFAFELAQEHLRRAFRLGVNPMGAGAAALSARREIVLCDTAKRCARSACEALPSARVLSASLC